MKLAVLFIIFMVWFPSVYCADLSTDDLKAEMSWTANGSVLLGVNRYNSKEVSPVVVKNGFLQTNCYEKEVATGGAKGVLNYYKFGFGEVGTAFEAVWDGAVETGVTGYNYITDDYANGTKLWLSSTDVNDTTNETGARVVYIEGLDENWEEQNELVVMAGRLTAESEGVYKRIFRAYIVTAGSSAVNEGDIYIHHSDVTDGVPDTLGEMYALIRAGNGQTLMAVFTVPSNKFALATAYTRGVGQGKEATVRIRLRSVTNNAWNVRFVDQLYQNTVTQKFAYPTYVPELVDMEIQAKVGTGTVLVQTSLGFLLVDDE